MTAPEKMNTTALAYLGDAIYESYIRERVIRRGSGHADQLHRAAVPYVCAQGQANAVRRILPSLSEEEQALVRRARNRKSATKPRNADAVTYKWKKCCWRQCWLWKKQRAKKRSVSVH